jgi:hypothetical protein
MVFKVHIQDFSHIGQGSVCSVEQIIFANVILWLYPLALEYSKKRFREGFPPGRFLIRYISCANADKKRLNVSSGEVLPEDASQAAFTTFTLCQSASMALSIVSSSAALLIIGLAPCPGRFSYPSMPSAMNLSTHLLIDCWHKPTFSTIFDELNPSAFNRTARQR